MEHGLALAAVLFVLGLAGVLVRRNILFMLMSLEVMMNAAALAFVVAGIWFAISYFGSQAMIDMMTGARKVERKSLLRLYSWCSRIC